MKLLLSIKPEYSEKILSGEKKFEFRKRKPKKIVDQVFIYESHPTQNIVGWFKVKEIHSGSPQEIWKQCKDSGGIEEKKYLNYCNGSRLIYAIEIDETRKLVNPIDPFEIFSDFKPPQSFSYLEDSIINNALGKKDLLIHENQYVEHSLLDFGS